MDQEKNAQGRRGGSAESPGAAALWFRRMYAVSLSFPAAVVLLFLIGWSLNRSGFSPRVQDFEEPLAQTVMYILFGMGVAIFFFCDGVADFLAGKFLVRTDSPKRAEAPDAENRAGYMALTFIMLSLLGFIGILGFVGFILSGNLTWFGVFVVLAVGLQFKYLPTAPRLDRILRRISEK